MRRIFLRRIKAYGLFLLLLVSCFMPFLAQWAQFGYDSDIFSYILLIPAISLYLVWIKRREIPMKVVQRPVVALAVLALAGFLMGGYALLWIQGWTLESQNHVALVSTGFVLFLIGGALMMLGVEITRFLAFPLGFLAFMVPFPVFLTEWVEVFYQYTSAELSYLLLRICQTPVFRDGLQFQLPGIVIEVARECSGIRSSLVLLIASLLGGHMLLHSNWRRAVLTLFVIPLGILRNGFRILTIALLCVHVGPDMIDSPIHHRGGPIFFLLSLIPLFILLVWLKRAETRREP